MMRRPFHFLLFAAAFSSLAGCNDAPKTQETASAMELAGYWKAPEITNVEMAGSNIFVVNGQTVANARVRFAYGAGRAIGVTSDSKGHFRAELPASALGGIYDMSTEDGGRSMHAEGRLFVPAQQPKKAVLLRSGAPSVPILPEASNTLVFDYDAAGGFALAGRVTPSTDVNLTVGDKAFVLKSDAQGYFHALFEVVPEGGADSVEVSLKAGSLSWSHAIPLDLATSDADNITPMSRGWRVDWMVPGGGMQTTLVF